MRTGLEVDHGFSWASVNRLSNVGTPRKRARETGGILSSLCLTWGSELVSGIVQKQRKGKHTPSIHAVPSSSLASNPQKKGDWR